MSRATPSPLRLLADIISDSVDKIDASFEKARVEYPKLDDPFNPTSPSEGVSMSPEVIQAASLVVSACAQLSATVHIPALTLYDAIGGFHVASALRAALESNTVEILRGQPQGLHVNDIAAQNGLDPVRISRLLRILATHYIFTEVAPDVFANNRLSSLMDTLKSVEEIKANPEDKHVNTPGMGALIEHSGDEIFKGSAFLTETLLDPVRGHSEAAEHAPLSLAFNTLKPSFEWFEEPGNESRLKRFSAAMEGSAKADPPDAILQGFKWSDLPANSLVVDVGGGIGHTTLKIRNKYPGLKYVVQDRPAVISQAIAYWNHNSPSSLMDGTVSLQAHDFFTPQTIQNASVFLCRMILHDYGKTKATQILKNLRAAATPDTNLLIVDQIVPYACLDESNERIGRDILGAEQMRTPKPLLANFGKATAIGYIGDLQMLVALNGEERTLGSLIQLTEASGWKIIRIFSIPGSIHKQAVAVPV